VLSLLQERCPNLLLQIHDFAEDGRPAVYHTSAYPDDCHYCVINSRDYGLLQKAGLSSKGLHLLPNMVSPWQAPPKGAVSPFASPYLLYPVRAIRRKNVGEAILLAMLAGTSHHLAVTLPPNSPADLASYRNWQRFTRRLSLPVRYEAGLRHSFSALTGFASSVLTTSINEGFGFSFLEPWTGGQWLWGRRIPGISDDFARAGIGLDHLYGRLRIPLGWIGRERLQNRFRHCIQQAWQGFGRPGACPHTTQVMSASMGSDGTVDFGILEEAWQRQVIARVQHSRRDHHRLLDLNPVLAAPFPPPGDRKVIFANRETIRSAYGEKGYTERISSLLARVVGHPLRQSISRQKLLALFFTAQPFSLLKWGNDHDHPET
jgi:hypothetical protein